MPAKPSPCYQPAQVAVPMAQQQTHVGAQLLCLPLAGSAVLLTVGQVAAVVLLPVGQPLCCGITTC